ncbi:phage portal protein, partial [Rhodobacteraceae bacterium WD3A24]
MSAKMNLIDRAVASFAPRIAARRMAARAALGQMDAMFGRKYEGAARGRGTGGWIASNTAADTEIASAADLLRARSRDLVRNNAHAAKAVQVLVSNIVGYGIRPRAVTGNPAFDEQVDNLWRQWSGRCDADGHTDFHGILSLAVREMIEGGEVFAMRRLRRQRDARVRGLDVPLQIEVREADHLDGAKSSLTSGRNAIKQGIEFDERGRRLAYWMFPEHPGDMTPSIRHSLQSVRVRADNVAHLFERQRVQSRGVPWAAPVMKALQDFDEWHNAELVRKKIEACVAAIVSGFEDEDERNLAPTVKDADGNLVEQFEPGMVAYARGAKQIDFNQPTASGGIAEWNRVQLHTIAAGYRVPYELMTGDLSQVNFSSSRV